MAPDSSSVFVCYARTDEAFVLPFAKELQAKGMHVWLDQWSIPKGADWDRSIDEAIAACVCFVIMLSPEAVQSEEVRGELRTALDRRKPTVPILLRPCEVPRRLLLRQQLDLSSPPSDDQDPVAMVMAAVTDAIAEAETGDASGVDQQKEKKPKAPAPAWLSGLTAPPLIGAIRRWGRRHVATLLAVALSFLLLATWSLFRLPVPSESFHNLIFLAAAVLIGLMLWCGNRVAAICIALLIAAGFMLKPLLVPFEGYGDGETFPYNTATAQDYWLPGAGFIVIALAVALASSGSRLREDLRRLRPTLVTDAVGLVALVAAALYFGRPTIYDVYADFRPQYAALRQELKTVASTIDDSNPKPCKVDPPLAFGGGSIGMFDSKLVLDARLSGMRDEDPSTTGHLISYQHLTNIGQETGELGRLTSDTLYLHLRDTSVEPILSSSVFTEFAEPSIRTSLQRVLDAPYLVVVKARSAGTEGAPPSSPAQSEPYRLFIYNRTRKAVICETSVDGPAATSSDLEKSVYSTLEKSVGATVLR